MGAFSLCTHPFPPSYLFSPLSLLLHFCFHSPLFPSSSILFLSSAPCDRYTAKVSRLHIASANTFVFIVFRRFLPVIGFAILSTLSSLRVLDLVVSIFIDFPSFFPFSLPCFSLTTNSDNRFAVFRAPSFASTAVHPSFVIYSPCTPRSDSSSPIPLSNSPSSPSLQPIDIRQSSIDNGPSLHHKLWYGVIHKLDEMKKWRRDFRRSKSHLCVWSLSHLSIKQWGIEESRL